MLLSIILLISCKTTYNKNIVRICLKDVNEYTKTKGCTYVCLSNKILRIRHLLDDDKDSLFVSFEAFQEAAPALDTISLLSGFAESFINCIIIFDKHKVYNYRIINRSNEKLENGIEYEIQLSDSIKVSYFFKFKEMDNNIRKMDFELLPNMVSRKRTASNRVDRPAR